MPFRTIGVVIIATAAVYVAVSIGLLRRRMWGWIGSLALDVLSASALLLLPFGGVGFGELLILIFLAAPLFVTIGLLIGGRHAVLATGAKTAAEPMPIKPARDV